MIPVSEVLNRFQEYQPDLEPPSSSLQAEVALVLNRETGEHDPSIVFIQRAASPDDPWSGPVSYTHLTLPTKA